MNINWILVWLYLLSKISYSNKCRLVLVNCRKRIAAHKSVLEAIQFATNLHEMTCLASCWFIATLKYVSSIPTGISWSKGRTLFSWLQPFSVCQRKYAVAFCGHRRHMHSVEGIFLDAQISSNFQPYSSIKSSLARQTRWLCWSINI